MTYTVSSGALNSSIPYHTIPHQAGRRRQQVVRMTGRRQFVIRNYAEHSEADLSMFGHGGGWWTDLPRLPRAVSDILVIKIILVLVLVSFQSNHFYFI